jgi:Type I restriction enzyme R protein N terminus (HSDR_N)
MADFWSNIPTEYTNEADVELRLVLPLLHALGYEREDIAAKYPVEFREGRVGRKPEADFVCFSGPLHTRDTSLVVVEAKKPGEALPPGKAQGESYAANVRSPLLLLTNGERVEIWQLQAAQESERVFEVEVASLAARRGDVERLLAKAAVIDYCRSFHVKTILEASLDFGRYETAELKRTARYGASIARTVHRTGSGDESEALHTDKLLAECPSGCVIIAPSGYGKTTLSNRLFRQAIEQRWRDRSKRLPFDVPVPDLEQTGLGIVTFMQERVQAHQPGLTLTALTNRLRDAGAIVFLDGFDRASPEYQRRLRTEIANLLRDYPLMQVFLFSRAAAHPVLAHPLFTLKPLSEFEKREMEKIILDEGSEPFFSIIGMMSPTLCSLCDNPLLLQLSLDYWKREHAFPNQLVPLFRFWLESVLNADRTEPVTSITRERAITVIANATRDGPVGGARVLELLTENDLPSSVLDELVSCDAARFNGAVVEVQHEALADYLRARELAEMPENELLAQIPALPMPPDSFFPVLLMAHLPTQRLQSALWKRLTKTGPSVYFDALRYRFDVSAELNRLDPNKLSEEYLTVLLEGIEQPLDSFFPALREAVIEDVTTERGSQLAVAGYLYALSGSLSYKLHVPQKADAPRVMIEVPSPPGILRGVNLDMAHYRLDSARLVGIALLKESVLEAVKYQALIGGPVWAEEHLIGRCRFLAKEYNLPLAPDMTLDAIERVLLPHKDKRVYPAPFSNREKFAIRSLLDDIGILRVHGKNALDAWWHRLGWEDKAQVQEEKAIRRVLDEQYRRIQVVYSEIVRGTFSGISDEMTFFAQFPVRWKLTILRRDPSAGGSTMYYTWSPVASWVEAGAEVAFGDTFPGFGDFEETRAALAVLGRPNDRIPRHDGFMPLSDFTGRQWDYHFDGATPVVHEVCSLLKDDLERVFSSMPQQDGV